MDFYNCPYVDVVPFRNRNEYDEEYRCGVTQKACDMCQCKLTKKEIKRILNVGGGASDRT